MFTSNQKFIATMIASLFGFAVMAAADSVFAGECNQEKVSNLSIESALSAITHKPVSEIHVCSVGNIKPAQAGYVSASVKYVIDVASMYDSPCSKLEKKSATVTVKGSCN